MEQEGKNEALLRKYLLGELNEADEQAFEEELLADDELSDLLLAEEDELIDDYLANDLGAKERERFDSHFMVTPERLRKLKFGETLSQYQPHPSLIGRLLEWLRRMLSFRSLVLAVAAMIVLALGIEIGRRVVIPPKRVSDGMVALRKAYPGERPTEARITDWSYAPPPPTTRGPKRDQSDYLALDRAKALIQLEASEHPSARSYHDLGRLYLAEREFDKAIDQFEKALRLDEKNARLHSDYGAALLETGKVDRSNDELSKSAEEFALSLEHLSKAIEMDASLLEALFNRAVLYEYMILPRQAESDWENYLKKDRNSNWADEAREHVRILEEQQKTSQSKEQILQDFLDAYRSRDDERAWSLIRQTREILSGRVISEQLLDKHLETSVREESGAASHDLMALAYLGELEAEKAGDLYTLRLIVFYRALSPNQMKLLAEARRLMKSGYESYSRPAPSEARGFFTKANQIFDELHDECESLYAKHWIGFCYRDAGQTEQSLAIFDPLVQICQEKNYKWLLMRSMLLLSSTQYSLNEYSKAIDWARRSLDLARQIGDTIGTFNALSVLVEEYRYINNRGQSLRCVQESLSVIDFCPLNPIQIGRHYGIVASAFNSFGFYWAAIEYQKELVRQASIMNHPQMTTIAYATLGLIYAKMGMQRYALENVQIACETARSNTDENIRKLMMANSSLQKANIYRQAGDWGKAIDSYNECIGIYDNLDFRYYTYQALKGRLYCYISQGEDALAKEELQRTLGLAEKYRSKILETDNRNNFFEEQQNVYDLAMDFEYSRTSNFKRAYEYSEESRARSLFDLLNASGHVSSKNGVLDMSFAAAFKALSLEEVWQGLSDKVQIIQYAVLEDKLLIWVVSKGDLKNEQRAITQKSLTDKVLHYLELISSPSAGSNQDEFNTAKELFSELIEPVKSYLDSTKQLCIVPDKALNRLPFGALMSSSGEYLIKQYHLLNSPSSSVFVHCSQTAASKPAKKSERLLSIGNPSFDRKAFRRLEDLESAAKEAEQITGYYPSGWCSLTGSSARKTRVMDEMKKSDVIHFALHSVADKRSPLHSKLLLAKSLSENSAESDTEAVLEAYEIYGLKLKRARLVVLSACETGRDQYSPGEGMLNIARPFLVAGVPLTVASLWPVETKSTAELMVLFHKHRKENNGMSTVDALRQAQLDLLESSQPRLQRPYTWAPFITIGGYASF